MKNNTKGWIFFAENDMILVESAIDEPRLTGQVIFHSQQAIEKYFKSYLVERVSTILSSSSLIFSFISACPPSMI